MQKRRFSSFQYPLTLSLFLLLLVLGLWGTVSGATSSGGGGEQVTDPAASLDCGRDELILSISNDVGDLGSDAPEHPRDAAESFLAMRYPNLAPSQIEARSNADQFVYVDGEGREIGIFDTSGVGSRWYVETFVACNTAINSGANA